MMGQEPFTKLNNFFTKIDNKDDFFANLDQTMHNLVSLQEDFNIFDFRDSLKLLFEDGYVECIYELLIRYDDTEFISDYFATADSSWKHAMLNIMAKYGPWLKVLYNKDIKELGIKSFETKLVNRHIGWEIQSSLTTFYNGKFTFSDTPSRIFQYIHSLLSYIIKLNKYEESEIDTEDKEALDRIIEQIDLLINKHFED